MNTLTIVLCFSRWKIADLQARVPRYELCRSAIFEKSRKCVQNQDLGDICGIWSGLKGSFQAWDQVLKMPSKSWHFSEILMFLCEWWSIVFTSSTSKIICIRRPTPIWKYVASGRASKWERIWVNNVRRERILKYLHTFPWFFSKIADLQAHSAALGAALWACRSAIFQRLKHKTMVKVVKS